LLWCSAVHGYCAPPMQHRHTRVIHLHPFAVPKFSWQVNDTKEESWQNILDSNSYSALAQVFCYSEDLYGNLKYSQTAPLTVKTTDSWTPNWAMRLATDDPFTFPRKDKDGKWTPEINTNHHLRFLILMRIIWPQTTSKSPSRFTKRASEILGHHGTKASDSSHLSDGPVNHRRSEPGAEMICDDGTWDTGTIDDHWLLSTYDSKTNKHI